MMKTETKHPKGEIPPEFRWKLPIEENDVGYWPTPYESVEAVCGTGPEEEVDCVGVISEKYRIRRTEALGLCKKAAKMAMETPVCYIYNFEKMDPDTVYFVIERRLKVAWIIYRRPWDGWVKAHVFRDHDVVFYSDIMDAVFKGERPYYRRVFIYLDGFKVVRWDRDVVWL